eukprot:407421-Rhodomonas_salina.1
MKYPTTSHKPARAYSRLTPAQVLEIFSLRPARSEQDQTFVPATDFCHRLAKHFNVCDRVIRDIWNRRSWGRMTRAMWTDAEIAADPSTCKTLDGNKNVVPAKNRAPGRPQGAKDTSQRARHKRAIDASSFDAQTCVPTEEASVLVQPPTASKVENKIELEDLQASREKWERVIRYGQDLLRQGDTSPGHTFSPPQPCQDHSTHQAPPELARPSVLDSLRGAAPSTFLNPPSPSILAMPSFSSSSGPPSYANPPILLSAFLPSSSLGSSSQLSFSSSSHLPSLNPPRCQAFDVSAFAASHRFLSHTAPSAPACFPMVPLWASCSSQ